MKKLIVTLEYPPQIGGIASYVHNFLLHVENAAQDFVLYAPGCKGDKEFDEKNAWKTFRRKPYIFFWPHWIRMVIQVWKIVISEKINELHIHQTLPAGYVGYLLKKIRKIPYVIYLHGTDVSTGTSSAWKERLFSMVLRDASYIVVNSRFLENKLRTRVDELGAIKVVYPCPSTIFLNIIEPEKIQELKKQLALEGKKIILTVSRMVDGKGYPHIIRLLNSISKQVPNVVWIFIGDGPKKHTIVELVQRNNLQNVVRFLGAIPNGELPQYYQLADLFVLLTHQDQEAEESWGSVYLEAAASGIPVVAGMVGGAEEAVEHLRTGVIVDVYQEKLAINSIVDLLQNEGFAKSLGEAGRERVLREFQWEKQIQNLDLK